MKEVMEKKRLRGFPAFEEFAALYDVRNVTNSRNFEEHIFSSKRERERERRETSVPRASTLFSLSLRLVYI